MGHRTDNGGKTSLTRAKYQSKHTKQYESHNQWRVQDFPEVGVPTNSRGGGATTHDFAKFSRVWLHLKNVSSLTVPTRRPPSCSVTRALSCRLSASWVCLTTARYFQSSLTTTTSRRTGRSEAAGSVPWRPTSP